jgi:hypothetical protein
MSIAGYDLRAMDCGVDLLLDAPTEAFCPKCGSCLDRTFVPSLALKVRRIDFGFTYDNRLLISDAAKQLIETESSRNTRVDFKRVCAKPVYWYPVPAKVLRFDPGPAEARFLNLCAHCGQYQDVVGATPLHVRPGERILDRGIYRTDLEFGSDRE